MPGVVGDDQSAAWPEHPSHFAGDLRGDCPGHMSEQVDRHHRVLATLRCESKAKVFVARVHPLQAMWSTASLSAQVSSVSHLLSRVGVAGADSWRGEIELVRKAEVGCQR